MNLGGVERNVESGRMKMNKVYKPPHYANSEVSIEMGVAIDWQDALTARDSTSALRRLLRLGVAALCGLFASSCERETFKPKPLGLLHRELRHEMALVENEAPSENALAANRAWNSFIRRVNGRYVEWEGFIHEVHVNGEISVDMDQEKEGFFFKTMEPELKLKPLPSRSLLDARRGDEIKFKALPVWVKYTHDGRVTYDFRYLREID